MKLQKSSKILALAISLAMLISAMPLVAMAYNAASPITFGDITVTENGLYYDVVVPYTVTGDVASQTTILVTKAAEVDTTGDTNILFIDQVDKSASISFSVAIADVVDNEIFIKMGGYGVDEPQSGTKTTGTVPDGFSVTGFIETYSSGATVSLQGTDKTANTDADGLFTLTEVEAGTYVLVITAKAALTRSIDLVVAETDVVVSTSENKVSLMFGDVDGSGKIDNSDLMTIKSLYNTTFGSTGFNANADLDDSGKVDNSDLMTIKSMYNRTPLSYPNWIIQ